METAAYCEQASIENEHWWFVARRAILRKVADSLSLKRGQIVELGSGTGGNIEWLSELGTVLPVEPSTTARSYSKKRNPSLTHFESLDQLKSKGPVCAAFALDVLEHIEDPVPILKSLSELMSADAPLVVTVPAHPFLYGPHDRYLHHQRRYSKALLLQHLQAGGFEVEYLSAMNCLLFPVATAARLLDRFRSGEDANRASGTTLPRAPLNFILRQMFALERHVVPSRRLPIGLSWLAIARRSSVSS